MTEQAGTLASGGLRSLPLQPHVQRPAFAIGALVLIVGAAAACHPTFHAALLERLLPGVAKMGSLDPMLLFLCGTCLVALASNRRAAPSPFVGVCSLAVCGIAGYHLAMAFIAVIASGGPPPMALLQAAGADDGTPLQPRSGLGFLGAGVALWLSRSAHRGRGAQALLYTALIALAAFGLVGLTGHVLQLQPIESWDGLGHTTPTTAFTLALLAFGIWLLEEERRLGEVTSVVRDQGRIARRSFAILALVAVGAGVAGFTVMRDSFDESLSSNKLLTARTNAEALAGELEGTLRVSRLLATRLQVHDTLARLNADPHDRGAIASLNAIGSGIAVGRVTGLSFRSRSGAEVSTGTLVTRPPAAPAYPLQSPGTPSELLVDDGFLLQSQVEVGGENGAVGWIVLQQRLPLFDLLLRTMRGSSAAGGAAVCSRVGDMAHCPPIRVGGEGLRLPFQDGNGTSMLPMHRGLRGETGVARITDLHGVPVLAAFTPIDRFGLALVFRTDIATAYGPLRTRLAILSMVIAAMIVLAALVQRGQIRPLLRDIADEQRRSQAARRDASRSLQVQEGIVELQQQIAASEADLGTLMEQLAEGARALTGAMTAIIAVRDGDHMVFQVVAGANRHAEALRTPIAGSLAGLAMERMAVLQSDDVEEDPRITRHPGRAFGTRAALAAPLRRGAQAIGAFLVWSNRSHAFDERDVATLQILSEALNLAMQRAAAAENLRTSEAEYRLTFASSPSPMWIHDGETGSFLAVNEAAIEKYGYSRQEFLSMRLHDLWPPRLAASSRRDLGERPPGMDAGSVWPHLLKDGSEIFVETASNDLRFHGRAARLVLVHDVTDSLSAQAELRSLNGHLELMVERRTADLDAARLEAEAASRAKSAFLATMSHEIRTPMNGVVGMIGALEHTPLEHEQKRMLDLARQSAEALMAIIEDILDFSKIEADQMELCREPMQLRHVLERSMAIVAGMSLARNVRVQTDLDADLPELVWGDETRLSQTLVNMLGNAIKFTTGRPAATVRLWARVRSCDDRAVALDIAVEDNGIGMDGSVVAGLFKPFTQADGSTTRRFGGTGLGLAISKRLTDLMGGEIVVASEPDVGSTFTLRVSFDIVRAAVDRARYASWIADRSHQAVTGPRPPRPERILVAEDNETNQEVIKRQLAVLGYEAEVASNGAEALDLCRSGRFSLLLTDLQMPAMDGYALTEAVREGQAGDLVRGLPIIALTANALHSEAERCRQVGIDDYLTKPIAIAALRMALDRHLEPAGESPPARAAIVDEAPPAGDEPVDASVLPQLVGDDVDTLRELFLDFSTSAEAAAGSVRRELVSGDLLAAAVAAHRLVAAARSVGAMRLGELSARLEHAARDGDDSEAIALGKALEREAAAVVAWIGSRHGRHAAETV